MLLLGSITTYLVSHHIPSGGAPPPPCPRVPRCCLVYSYIAMAPLTCTLRDRMRPSWGISTVESSSSRT